MTVAPPAAPVNASGLLLQRFPPFGSSSPPPRECRIPAQRLAVSSAQFPSDVLVENRLPCRPEEASPALLARTVLVRQELIGQPERLLLEAHLLVFGE